MSSLMLMLVAAGPLETVPRNSRKALQLYEPVSFCPSVTHTTRTSESFLQRMTDGRGAKVSCASAGWLAGYWAIYHGREPHELERVIDKAHRSDVSFQVRVKRRGCVRMGACLDNGESR